MTCKLSSIIDVSARAVGSACYHGHLSASNQTRMTAAYIKLFDSSSVEKKEVHNMPYLGGEVPLVSNIKILGYNAPWHFSEECPNP